MASETPYVCNLQAELAGQLALPGKVDDVRVWRLHVVVQAMRNLKARPERIIRRQRWVADRACRNARDVRKIVNAREARRRIGRQPIGRIGDAVAEPERPVLVKGVNDSLS